MDIEELKISYYHDSLKLAQQAVYTGLLISALAYLSVMSKSLGDSYSIPILNVPVTSLQTFAISLVVLYFFCGSLCAFGAHRASLNWREITDREIARCILNAPNILLSNHYLKAILYALFFTIGASLVTFIFELKDWKSLICGSVVAAPYFYAFRISEYLKEELESTANKSSKPTPNGAA